jgi:Spy/CpxP family protein refolding chaperone
MKRSLLNIAAVSALAAGMAFGQSAPAQNAPAQKSPHAHAGNGAMMGKWAADLNLTDAQKQQAESIFSAARQSAQPIHAQIKQNREALAAAVKSGASDAEIDKLSNNLAPLLAQSTAIHTKAFAKFYATLTPEQKSKVGDRFSHMMYGMHGRGQGARQNREQSDR